MMRLWFEGPTAGLIVIAPEAAFCNDCAWQYTCAAEERCERRDRGQVRARRNSFDPANALPRDGIEAGSGLAAPTHEPSSRLFPETTPNWLRGVVDHRKLPSIGRLAFDEHIRELEADALAEHLFMKSIGIDWPLGCGPIVKCGKCFSILHQDQVSCDVCGYIPEHGSCERSDTEPASRAPAQQVAHQ